MQPCQHVAAAILERVAAAVGGQQVRAQRIVLGRGHLQSLIDPGNRISAFGSTGAGCFETRLEFFEFQFQRHKFGDDFLETAGLSKGFTAGIAASATGHSASGLEQFAVQRHEARALRVLAGQLERPVQGFDHQGFAEQVVGHDRVIAFDQFNRQSTHAAFVVDRIFAAWPRAQQIERQEGRPTTDTL